MWVSVAILVSGCASSEHPEGHGAGLDTGNIASGDEAVLTFATSGVLPLHCHPHPWMMHNVTIAEGGPLEAHVHIVDNKTALEGWRFEPENLTVGIGARVTYHNHGNQTHTATQKTTDAAPAAGH